MRMCLKRICRLSWRKWMLYAFAGIYLLLVAHAVFKRNPRVVYNMPEIKITLPDACQINVNNLGLVNIDMSEATTMKKITAMNSKVSVGGAWKPEDCQPQQKVAVLLPYRDRYHHLLLILKRLHLLMNKQKLHYRIYIIEQSGNEPFNRGRLLNIGVREALKDESWDCFILHDVDLLPEHDGNLYMCDAHLRHLASAIDEMRYHVLYSNYAGGVAAMSTKNLHLVNGFSNDYWGWGSEDDDFSARCMESGLLLTRPPEHIGRYKMARHVKQWRIQPGYGIFLTWRSRWKSDGLNNVASKCSVVSRNLEHLYTNVTVNIGSAPTTQQDTSHLPKESLWWLFKFFFL